MSINRFNYILKLVVCKPVLGITWQITSLKVIWLINVYICVLMQCAIVIIITLCYRGLAIVLLS